MRAIPLRFDRLPRYMLLLGAIMLEIVVAPMLISGWESMFLTRLITGAVLVTAMWAIGPTRNNTIGFSLAAAGLICAGLSRDPTYVTIDYALRALFIGYVAGALLWSILQQQQVTMDTLAGAAAAYVLIGFAWAPVYLLVEHLRPGSFDIPDAWRIGSTNEISPAMVYFSYITLTTVGFGDIKPSGPVAGGLVIVEAVIGPLYLAIMIARLVGLHLARPRE